MATEVRRRRGTSVEHSTFTGAVAELTVDLTKDTVVVHDGSTQGGFPLLREDFDNVPTTAPFTNISLDTAIFDTGYSADNNEAQGTLYWNQKEETLSLVTNGETIELGQKIEVHVKNQTGSQIDKGEVVYASGTLGASGRILVTKMIADGTIAAKRILGVAAENIANGADGKVVKFGKIRKVDTSAYDAGDILWVSTTTAGAFQNTEPVQADGEIALPIAFVVYSSSNNGEIFVRVTPIDENEYQNYDAGLQDIAGLTPTDSTIIVGDGTNWVGESGDTARTSLGLGTGDSPTFSGLTVNGSITVTGTVDGRDISDDGADLDELYTTIGLSALTAEEVNQLENIGETTTISATQWGYLGDLDQPLSSGDSPTFNILSISDSITDASTTYVAGITGVGTIYDMDNGNGSFFEVDNMRVRNEMRVHIFKKDIVKASNAYLFITDSAEVAKTTTITDDTGTFRVVDDGTNASFEHGDLLWAKNLQDDGSLQATGVKIQVSAQPKYVWDNSTQQWDADPSLDFSGYADEFFSGTDDDSGKAFTQYNVYAVEGAGGTLNAGDTIVRVNGGSILNDASSDDSPFIDIYDGVNTWADFQSVDKTKVRLGNLAAVSNASGYGLYTQNAFLTGALVVGDLTKAGNYLEYSGGNLSGVFNDIDFDSNTFRLETTNLRIDSQDEIIQIGSGDWVELGNLGSSEYGLSLNSNNYWKYNTLASTYFFKVGSATNFISFNTASGTLDIETDTFDLATTNLSIDSANELITLGTGTTVNIGKIDATNFGLSLDANNFWKVSSGEYFFKVGSATNFISFDTSSGTLDITADTFDLATSTFVIDSDNNKIALGTSPDSITIAGTEAGFIANGSGEFKAYIDSDNYIRLNSSGLNISAELFDIKNSDIRLTNNYSSQNSDFTSSVTYSDTLQFAGLFFDSDNYLGHITDVDTSANSGYLFRVGGTTSNFLEVNEAGSIAKINFDTFTLDATDASGGIKIDSANELIQLEDSNRVRTQVDVNNGAPTVSPTSEINDTGNNVFDKDASYTTSSFQVTNGDSIRVKVTAQLTDISSLDAGDNFQFEVRLLSSSTSGGSYSQVGSTVISQLFNGLDEFETDTVSFSYHTYGNEYFKVQVSAQSVDADPVDDPQFQTTLIDVDSFPSVTRVSLDGVFVQNNDLQYAQFTRTKNELSGQIFLKNLPDSDPSISGQLYRDSSGNLKVSL